LQLAAPHTSPSDVGHLERRPRSRIGTSSRPKWNHFLTMKVA
jgi:hypothetical protein